MQLLLDTFWAGSCKSQSQDFSYFIYCILVSWLEGGKFEYTTTRQIHLEHEWKFLIGICYDDCWWIMQIEEIDVIHNGACPAFDFQSSWQTHSCLKSAFFSNICTASYIYTVYKPKKLNLVFFQVSFLHPELIYFHVFMLSSLISLSLCLFVCHSFSTEWLFVCLSISLSFYLVITVWLSSLFSLFVSVINQLTCPVAMKSAVTMLAACALNPPIAPATAEPTRFLLMLSSANADTLVFRT